jgi:acetyltransferase-like isoleucine patch superfamily enzyme
MKPRNMWNTARTRYWLRNCSQVGDDAQLTGKPTIYATGELRIGHHLRLASRPVVSHLVAGPGAILEIGDEVRIGCGAAIAAYQQIRIGSGTTMGPFVIIMDTNFHSASGDQSVQHDCRPVSIGRNCRIGARVTITRGVSIGDGVQILAGSVVGSAIPAGFCAAGARAAVIGRAGVVNSRDYVTAAALPVLLQESLELDSAPDLDDERIPVQLWTQDRIQRVSAAIEQKFGIALDCPSLTAAATFADIATAVHQNLHEQWRRSRVDRSEYG